MTKSIHFTSSIVEFLNGEIYIGREEEDFEIGIATPPPQRPGDEPILIPLVRFFRDKDGKMVSARCPLEGSKRMRILQKIKATGGQGATVRRIVDVDAEEAEKLHAAAKFAEGKPNVFEEVVGMMAAAESLGLHYRVVRNELNKDSFVLEVRLNDRDLEKCPIVPGAWEIDNIKSELCVLAKRQEEERRREEIKKQALAKLTPEERDALGYHR